MPELPEVETVKKVLIPIVKGNTIASIDVLRKSTIVGSSIDEFKSALINKTFLNITRIGKFLIFHLSDDVVMISHLRMEGKYFELEEQEPNTKYARVVFHLNNNHKICYDDSRCFGMMKISNENDYLKVKDIAQLGPEPFEIKDVNYLVKKVKNKTNPIKSTLLDQTLMTGLGNIYVDETLFASKIHPLTPSNKITKKEWETIVSNASRILASAIEAGGSTIRSYHPGKNIDGEFQFALKAYGKNGEDCPNCGHAFRFIRVGGRGTTYCPNCQVKKYGPLKVGITGKIASGKSTVLDVFKKNNIKTISSDEIVANLYKTKEIANKIAKRFDLPFSNFVYKDILRNYLIKHPNDRKILERMIHPLVIKEIEKFFKNEEGIMVAEVPLLFEAKMENMFDYIIAVDIDPDLQEKRLIKRNPLSAKDLKTINSNNVFEANKKKADIIISNNSSLSSFEKSIKSIINKLQDRQD